MEDLKIFAGKLKQLIYDASDDFERLLVEYLNDNDWFGSNPEFIDGKCMVDDICLSSHMSEIIGFFDNRELTTEDKVQMLAMRYAEKQPEFASKVEKFFDELSIPEDNQYYIYDFLLSRQIKSFSKMRDNDVAKLVEHAVFDLTKADGDIFCMLLSWLKQYHHVPWIKSYSMTKRVEIENGAYDLDEYLHLLYYLFCPTYIEENEMYKKAAESKNYADTWLYLNIHFMHAIRNTDIQRIGHPELTASPEEVLKMIKDSTFPKEDARLTLYSITWRLEFLMLTPNKSASFSNVPSLKFNISESCEVHLGTLLAICEAHFLLSGEDKSTPLIRIISDYERINRYMGEEIGVLFLESNFRSRGIQKSYLQDIWSMTDVILGDERDEFHVKGNILASLARSHKGSYGAFVNTTVAYLKDAKFNGLTPEFVARELFERGVLSCIPSMLLNMVTNYQYNHLTIKNQTKMQKMLDLTPAEVEKTVALVEKANNRTNEVIKELFSSKDMTTDGLLMILHRIGGGDAASKCDGVLCLMSAIKKTCPYSDRGNCYGCEYEISTKSTIFAMASEYNRLRKIAQTSTDEKERTKSVYLIQQIVLPRLQDVLICLRDNYGEDAVIAYEKIVRDSL